MLDINTMDEKALISRINFFSKKAKEGTLSEEETKDRDVVRKEYIRRVTGSLKTHLEHIKK